MVLSRDTALLTVAASLLDGGDLLIQYASAAELAEWANPGVSTVVLDSQPEARPLAYGQLRQRYAGPLIMLLDPGEGAPPLPSDAALRLLRRPFQPSELSALLTAPPSPLGALERAAIGAWSRHTSAAVAAAERRAAALAAIALVGVAVVSDPRSCGSACGSRARASESPVPLTSRPGRPAAPRGPGPKAPAAVPPGGGTPVVGGGITGLVAALQPITSSDTGFARPTPPPGVPPPVATAPPSSGTPSTAPPTSAPPTTAPPTTAPATTAPPTTAPPTTEPPTSSEPATTAAQSTAPASTAAAG